jgi:hypothetical protein
MCQHQPPCPDAHAPGRDTARVTAAHPEQGWSRLCNGVILFDDTGELLPDGTTIPPHRGPAIHTTTSDPTDELLREVIADLDAMIPPITTAELERRLTQILSKVAR